MDNHKKVNDLINMGFDPGNAADLVSLEYLLENDITITEKEKERLQRLRQKRADLLRLKKEGHKWTTIEKLTIS